MKETLLAASVAGFLFAAFFGGMGWVLMKGERRFRKWEQTSATIITSELTKRIDPTPSSRDPKQVYWYAKIIYKYSVDGRQYIGNRYANVYRLYQFSAGQAPRELLQRVEDNYVRKNIQIYFSVNDPSKSYMKIIYGSSFKFFLASGVSIFLGLIAFRFWLA